LICRYSVADQFEFKLQLASHILLEKKSKLKLEL